MKTQISKDFLKEEEQILHYLHNFRYEGESYGTGKRNTIKIFPLNDIQINIKSFQIPNSINKIAYRFFRKSKAERSFNYAKKLLKFGINTPAPVAYAEEMTSLTFLKSFYVSEHIDYDLTFRDLDLKKEGHEEILRAFTHFTFQLHEKGVEFLDHSPGNTLIQTNGNSYKFYLVDLNRMNFKNLNFTERMRNFERLSRERQVYEIMANEYAKLINRPVSEVFNRMWHFNQSFLTKRHKKEMIKKKFKQK